MTLRDYFRQPDSLSQTEIAALCDIKVAAINHYVHGRRTPSIEVAVAISEATGGLVSVGELLSHAIPDGYELVRKEVVA
jgi:plasmid maintenance system antidote protein VapI